MLETVKPTRAPITASDGLFFQLDGRHIVVDHRRWRIDVCGVHSTEQHHWVQVNLCGEVSYGATFRSDVLEARRFMRLIADWLAAEMREFVSCRQTLSAQ